MKRSNACSTRMIQTAKSAALALAIALSPYHAWAQKAAPAPPAADQKNSSEAKPSPAKPTPSASDSKKIPINKPTTTKAKTTPPVEKKEATKKTPSPKPVATLPDQSDAFEQIQLFTRVLELVRQSYVDPNKTTYKKLISSALEGMLADLDPHSQFMHAKVFEQLKKNTGSTYEGVGITISFRNEVLSIVTVREDGPAARANVLPGDQILKINNFLIKDVGLSEAVALLKGKPGEKLKLTLRRPATKKVFAVEMVREIIKQKTVKDIRLLDKKITGPHKVGYARILQFSEPTAEEFSTALDHLEKQGMQAFILDLRNNPGGLLHTAISVSGEFVPANSLVLTTEARDGLGIIKPYRTPSNKHHDRNYPVAILLNHSSASASEVVAGALQDLNRAIIIGETSFGKGSVQSIIPVGSGTAVRLTTAKYYTPSHRTIHENGVKPNITSTLTSEEERQLMRWWRRDSLSPEERKKASNFQDRQLDRAIDAMKGALVYAKREGDTKAAAKKSPDKKPVSDPKPPSKEKVSPAKKAPVQTPSPSPKKDQPNKAKEQ
ncbi:MAG: S41 family peptidase [Verrucomicrobiales bacterium]|nr:S41 family peptidase [Verrucomicrobiales bacterium]